MMENENVAYELLGISNYGEFEEAQELLRSNRTNNKEDAKKNQENDLTAKDTAGHQRRPKSRKNNRGIRGNCVIIPVGYAEFIKDVKLIVNNTHESLLNSPSSRMMPIFRARWDVLRLLCQVIQITSIILVLYEEN